MEFINNNLLMLILFTPLLGMTAVMLAPNNKGTIARIAFAFSLIPLLLTLYLWANYDFVAGGFQFEVNARWYPSVNAGFHLGVDGLSVPMVLLANLLVPLCILASFNVDRIRGFMALFFILQVGTLGVFLSLDLLLFFAFYEVGLVPMYFLINQWGSPKGKRELSRGRIVPAREYASFKFMIYTMAAGLGLLLAIQLIGITQGTFDLPTLYATWPTSNETFLNFASASTVKTVAFWAFFVAFAIKVPLFPFHTWLPDAHTEAPTAGSMILAGVLLKLGAYGFLRLVIPLFPEQSAAAAPIIALLGMLSIILAAYSAYGQTDFKRLVAYSSVNHMGFVVLGLAVVAWAAGNAVDPTTLALAGAGAVIQMFNHGLSAAAMFFLVGVVYERAHTRNLDELGGGIWQYAPIYGGMLIFSSMASLGLPGLNGFVGEFAIVRGSWPIFTFYTALSMIGLFMTGAYVLKGIRKVLHGPINPHWADHNMEMNVREIAVMAPLLVLMLLIGVWPASIANMINYAIVHLFG